MKNILINSFLLTIVFFVSGCNKTFDSSEELQSYVLDEKNGYVFSKEVNGIRYVLQFKPADQLVFQELGDDYTDKLVSELREKYSKYIYFSLSMSVKDQELLNVVANDKMKFGKLVNELAFGLENKIHLYTKEHDTLKMADYIYPRMFGASNSTSIMVAFEKSNEMFDYEYLNLVVKDLGFNTGDVKFKIKTEQLKNNINLKF